MNISKKLQKIFLANLFFSFKKKIINHTFIIPVNRGICVCSINPFKKYYENHMDKIFKKYYSEDTLLIDLGANIGQTLIKWIGIGGKSSNYIGFDPNPNCFSYLFDFLEINNLSNSKIICSGLSNSTKLSVFELSNQYDTRASSNKDYRFNNYDDSFELYFPLLDANYCLDKFNLNYKKIIIKIDVEGNEYDILCSLKNLINKFKPIIIVEILSEKNFCNSKTNAFRKTQLEIIGKFFKYNKYKISRIFKNGSLNGNKDETTDDFLCIPN